VARPWKGRQEAPRNLISRQVYRGINLFLLNAAGYQSPFWLTFKQVHLLGGSIRKGEHSFPVVFWKIFEEEGNGDARKIPFLRYHSVFNVAQCEGMSVPSSSGVNGSFTCIEKCEEAVTLMQSPPKIEHGGLRASYSPVRDMVSMPEKESFEKSEF
jgi:antirestriction protein ArdC